MQHISVSEFAKIKNVSAEAVRKAIAGGRLVNSVKFNKNGKCPKIDPVVAMAEWEANTRHDMRRTGKDVRKPDARPEPFIRTDILRPAQPPSEEDMAERIGMNEATRRKEVANAKMAELKLATAQGLYIETAKVKAEGFKLARTVRDAMLNIPDRVSAEFAGIQNAAEIHMRLTDELRMALQQLADMPFEADPIPLDEGAELEPA